MISCDLCPKLQQSASLKLSVTWTRNEIIMRDYHRGLRWSKITIVIFCGIIYINLEQQQQCSTTPLLHVLFSRIHSVLFYSRSTNLALMMIIFIRESNLKCHSFSISSVAKFIHFKHWAQKFDEVNTHLSRLYYLEKIIDFFHITKNYPVQNWGVFAATVLYQSDDNDDEITRCNAWSPLVWSPFFTFWVSVLRLGGAVSLPDRSTVWISHTNIDRHLVHNGTRYTTSVLS